MNSKKRPEFKKAMTIVETLVAIAIFAIGIEGFALLFMRAWQSNSYTLEMGQSAMAVSQGVNKITGYIRGASQSDNGSYPVKSANDNDLVLYSDYDKDDVIERLHFYKSGQSVLMGVREPTGTMPITYASGDESVITIASHIINDANNPIFEYYNQGYPGDTTNNPMITPASVSAVRMVKIHLYININPNRAPDNIEMQTFVELRNL
jgi:type II secretory pathway pseudopilin PulG